MAFEWISFDLDGTLIDLASDESRIWREVVPKLYAEKNSMPFEDARKYCQSQYDSIGSNDVRWYNKDFWFSRLNLGNWRDNVDEFMREIRIYPEVEEVLSELSEDYKLVIFTNNHDEYMHIKLKHIGLDGYFDELVSATRHLNTIKVHKEAYELLLERLGASKEKLLHVGDYYPHDYVAAKQAGIKSLLVDRKKQSVGEHVIADLTGVKKHL